MGRKNDRIAELEQEVNRLTGTITVLEGWRTAWLAGFKNEAERLTVQTTVSALNQLWDLLQAPHQTQAVINLQALIERDLATKQDQQNRIWRNQEIDSLREQLRVQKIVTRDAESARDRNHASLHTQSFDLANTKARVEELEQVIQRAIIGLAPEDGQKGAATIVSAWLTEVLGDEQNSR